MFSMLTPKKAFECFFSLQTLLECPVLLSHVQNKFATASVLFQFHWLLP